MQTTELERPGFERVLRLCDPAAGLTGFIVIHSTARGPAAGGLRMRVYAGAAEALDDALRLARGMSYKNAAADLPLGGGKAVILGDPARDKSPALLDRVAEAVEALDGAYWTAEDMGMTPGDMERLAATTRFVAGRSRGRWASGDPSPVTARGVLGAIRVGARHRFGSGDLAGRRVAVQGLGHVGMRLAGLLRAAGARLTVTDADPARMAEAAARLGAATVPPAAIHAAPADIFAPCALGGVLNAATIPGLTAGLVAGAANNQLATPEDGRRLRARGILYVPDYLANAGGIVNVATEILRIGDRDGFVAEKLAALETSLDAVLRRAARAGQGPEDVADAEVAPRLSRHAA